ncbi:MAG TPA: GNAT family N-acetyltransferase [Polyangiaceae bacterium]|jgi:RimJ/RimL family protein N-acetyltransferase
MSTTPAIAGRTDAFSFAVPRIATARCLLREPRWTDFERFAANAADPLARKHVDGPLERREASRRFSAMAGAWVLHGIGWWVIEERRLGAIGTVGVFRRETAPDLEIGWSVDRPCWGKGYASEAARAALELTHATFTGERVVAFVDATNVASCAVAARIGMRREADADFYGEKHCFYVSVPGSAAKGAPPPGV